MRARIIDSMRQGLQGRYTHRSGSPGVWTRRDAIQAGISGAFCALVGGIADVAAQDYLPVFSNRPFPPVSKFGAKSTGDDVTSGLDLHGTTALITGCNSGIGFETLRVMAGKGAHVFGAARTLAKAEDACKKVVGKTTPLEIELTDFESIESAVDKVKALSNSLDALILNAGIMALPSLQQVNGIERQFVVNHLGHFLLTKKLWNVIVAAAQGRVVVVSSSAHAWAPVEGIQFDNLSGERGYDPFAAYGQSKLANGLFSRELARRLADTRATSNSLHPGVVNTNISRHLRTTENDNMQVNSRMKTIPQGAATGCYLAAHPDLRRVSGFYFADCNLAYPNAQMQDDSLAARLWSVSEELVRRI